MTRFAFAGKWRGHTAPMYFPGAGSASAAASMRGSMSELSAIRPRPRPRRARRPKGLSVSGDGFMEVEDNSGDARHGGEVGCVHVLRNGRFAHREQGG